MGGVVSGLSSRYRWEKVPLIMMMVGHATNTPFHGNYPFLLLLFSYLAVESGSLPPLNKL